MQHHCCSSVCPAAVAPYCRHQEAGPLASSIASRSSSIGQVMPGWLHFSSEWLTPRHDRSCCLVTHSVQAQLLGSRHQPLENPHAAQPPTACKHSCWVAAGISRHSCNASKSTGRPAIHSVQAQLLNRSGPAWPHRPRCRVTQPPTACKHNCWAVEQLRPPSAPSPEAT